MLEYIKKSSEYIKKYFKEKPFFSIVLGSGFSMLESFIENKKIIDYNEIPFFPKTTVDGHFGKLIYGNICKKKIIVMSGRFHYYEGLSMKDITFPIKVFKYLGVNNIILSNSSGGVNPKFKIGDLIIIKDHINLMPEHPLRGENIDELGLRFTDMRETYDRKIIEIAENIAKYNKINYHKGIYVGLQGPSFETPSEYNMIKKIGGDIVGMSTVPEAIVAKHMNMNIFGLSVVTNLGLNKSLKNKTLNHKNVLKISNNVLPSIIKIIKGIISNYKN